MNHQYKKAAAAVLAAVFVCSLAACGNGGKDGKGALTEIDPEEQVKKLCDYNGIEVGLAGNYAVTDDDVEDAVQAILENMGGGYIPVEDRTVVEDGDYVKVDYTGYLDGTAFENGAATDVMVEVSENNGYIPGFTDGLIGAETGSTVSSDVTFPEEYANNPDMAGKLTTFEFVVHGIYELATLDTLTDEMVAECLSESYGMSTKQELVDYARDYLEQTAESGRYSETVSAVRQYVLENSEAEIPDAYMDARLELYQKMMEADLEEGQDLESYLEDSYQVTLEEAKEQWKEMLDEQIRFELVFGLIAEKEGLEADEDGFSSYIQNFIDSGSFGFQEKNDVYEYFGGGDAKEGEAYMKELYKANQALDYAAEHAVVTENEAVDGTEN